MDQDPPAEHHYLLRYAKTGDARYLSLHDVRRAWERAARRAGLPLAYSRGFRPKPRLTFGPPLAVGTEGLRECVVLSLREDVPPAEVGERLAGATADGLAVGEVRRVARRKFATVWASYDLEVANPPDDLAERVAAPASGLHSRRPTRGSERSPLHAPRHSSRGVAAGTWRGRATACPTEPA